jgi:hypothetical protein
MPDSRFAVKNVWFDQSKCGLRGRLVAAAALQFEAFIGPFFAPAASADWVIPFNLEVASDPPGWTCVL